MSVLNPFKAVEMEPLALTARKNATVLRAVATLQLASAMKETARLVGLGLIVSDLVKMAFMACFARRSVDFAKEGNPAIRRRVNVKFARLVISEDYVRTSAS